MLWQASVVNIIMSEQNKENDLKLGIVMLLTLC